MLSANLAHTAAVTDRRSSSTSALASSSSGSRVASSNAFSRLRESTTQLAFKAFNTVSQSSQPQLSVIPEIELDDMRVKSFAFPKPDELIRGDKDSYNAQLFTCLFSGNKPPIQVLFFNKDIYKFDSKSRNYKTITSKQLTEQTQSSQGVKIENINDPRIPQALAPPTLQQQNEAPSEAIFPSKPESVAAPIKISTSSSQPQVTLDQVSSFTVIVPTTQKFYVVNKIENRWFTQENGKSQELGLDVVNELFKIAKSYNLKTNTSSSSRPQIHRNSSSPSLVDLNTKQTTQSARNTFPSTTTAATSSAPAPTPPSPSPAASDTAPPTIPRTTPRSSCCWQMVELTASIPSGIYNVASTAIAWGVANYGNSLQGRVSSESDS